MKLRIPLHFPLLSPDQHRAALSQANDFFNQVKLYHSFNAKVALNALFQAIFHLCPPVNPALREKQVQMALGIANLCGCIADGKNTSPRDLFFASAAAAWEVNFPKALKRVKEFITAPEITDKIAERLARTFDEITSGAGRDKLRVLFRAHREKRVCLLEAVHLTSLLVSTEAERKSYEILELFPEKLEQCSSPDEILSYVENLCNNLQCPGTAELIRVSLLRKGALAIRDCNQKFPQVSPSEVSAKAFYILNNVNDFHIQTAGSICPHSFRLNVNSAMLHVIQASVFVQFAQDDNRKRALCAILLPSLALLMQEQKGSSISLPEAVQESKSSPCLQINVNPACSEVKTPIAPFPVVSDPISNRNLSVPQQQSGLSTLPGTFLWKLQERWKKMKKESFPFLWMSIVKVPGIFSRA